MHSSVSVIVPVFNTAPLLETLAQRIMHTLSAYTLEVIFIDDGSEDSSWQKITEIAKLYPSVTGIRLTRNMGQFAATLIGLQHARHEVLVTMDDDLQHPPEYIPSLLAKLDEGFDMVYAGPLNQSQHSYLYAYLTNIVRLLIAFMSGAPYLRYYRTFRIMRADIFPWGNIPVKRHAALDGALKRSHPRVCSMEVEYARRMIGRSH